MKRVAVVWRIKPSHLDEYVRMHRNPWPELLLVLKQAGFNEYSIYLVGNMCFGHFETEGDGATAFANLEQYPVFKEWSKINTPRIEDEAVDGCGSRFLFIDEIFYSP